MFLSWVRHQLDLLQHSQGHIHHGSDTWGTWHWVGGWWQQRLLLLTLQGCPEPTQTQSSTCVPVVQSRNSKRHLPSLKILAMGTEESCHEALDKLGRSFATCLPRDVYFALIKPPSQQLRALLHKVLSSTKHLKRLCQRSGLARVRLPGQERNTSSSPWYATQHSPEHFSPVSGNNALQWETAPEAKRTCSTGLKAPIWKVRHENIFQIYLTIRARKAVLKTNFFLPPAPPQDF